MSMQKKNAQNSLACHQMSIWCIPNAILWLHRKYSFRISC